MNPTLLNPALRAELNAKWNKQDRPLITYPFYLAYQFRWHHQPHLLGSDDMASLDTLRSEMRDLEWAEIVTEYPYEIYQFWKDSDKKKVK